MPATTPTLSFDELLPLMTQDAVDAVAHRHGETEADHATRAASVRQLIEGFQAQDPVIFMLATQAVMMHALMRDSARDAERAATPDEAVKHRRQFATMLRLQLSQIRMIEKRRPAKAAKEEKPEQAPATTAATQPATPPRPQPPKPVSMAVVPPSVSPAREAPHPIPTPLATSRPGATASPLSATPPPVQVMRDVPTRVAAE